MPRDINSLTSVLFLASVNSPLWIVVPFTRWINVRLISTYLFLIKQAQLYCLSCGIKMGHKDMLV